MGSSKKHKKDRDSSSSASKSKSKHKEKLRAPSPPEIRAESSSTAAAVSASSSGRDRERGDRERERERERRHRDANKHRDAEKPTERRRERERSRERQPSGAQHHHNHQHGSASGSGARRPDLDYRSDDSDVVEVPMAPPAPKISAEQQLQQQPKQPQPPPPPSVSAARRSPSPIPENGAGDCLSVAETNKLRAKLGLKPLDVGDGGSTSADGAAAAEPSRPRDPAHAGLSMHKDEWGEFLHKPADNLASKLEAEKLREKIRQRKERRLHEERLRRVRKLGDEDDADDINVWLDRSRDKERNRMDAAKRAAALEEQDDQMDDGGEVQQRRGDAARRKAAAASYTDRHLKGLKVDHEMDAFGEGKTVILTLKDSDVLNDEEGDTLINVNMVDDERYKKNTVNKKLNPNSYGYNVYEEQFDHLGNPIERNILSKYDEEADDVVRKNFTIGEDREDERARQRRLQEIKTKLAGKRLETLDEPLTRLASDTYTEDEMAAKFKKPKKRVKKLRQKLKADDLQPLPGENLNTAAHHGRRRRADNDAVHTDDIKREF